MSSSTLVKRVALVTGSGKKRVGWHVADALSGQAYNIAVHYRSSAKEAAETVEHLHSRGVEAEAFQADLADETAVRDLIHAARGRFGRLDVLVNCAAVYAAKPLEEITAADVRHNFETNLLGTFLCAQQAGLVMVRQPEGGCIINFGDWATARPYLNYAAYFASKGAIPALTRCLAVELGTRNPRVRVNCILPGPVLFPPAMPKVEREEAIRSTLVQREGQPENVARAVLFFLQNDFVTGVSLPVDGGRSIYASDSSPQNSVAEPAIRKSFQRPKDRDGLCQTTSI
jgi:pteridine reductase